MKIPSHVAFIMDGNGRWANARGLKRTEGHFAGTENIRNIIRHSKDLGIRYVTFYAFSTENFKRPNTEVSYLMKLIGDFFRSEINEMITEGARIRILGDVTKFSRPVRTILSMAESRTKDNDTIHVNIALGYGGRQEIIEAVKKLVEEGRTDITEETFKDYLYTAGMPDVDLVIRTSGEQRVSNFLLYQIAYSELYFTENYWPDFTVTEYDKALEEFNRRTRRFGGIQNAEANH